MAVQTGHYDIIKLLTSIRENAKLRVDIMARDNLGKLPRHYLQKDRFTDEEVYYMSRVIGTYFIIPFTIACFNPFMHLITD